MSKEIPEESVIYYHFSLKQNMEIMHLDINFPAQILILEVVLMPNLPKWI